jgi:hypothetical protein
MMFPRRRLPSARRALLAVMSAMVLTAAGLTLGPGTSAADDPPPPPLHQVKYTVFSEQPYSNLEIYYRDTDPPNWADYSHDPYLYSPNVEADVGPDKQWILDVQLANPDEWAMVTAGTAGSPHTPNVHCVLAVDGVVVATNQGPKGALCSLRAW